ncbi:hypothetical protein ABZP36_009728 [Zizania latifolia]
MPFFLFIIGMAIPLSLKRIPDRSRAVRRVVIRTLKLLFWGILLQGGYSHAPDELTYGVDMKHIRWCGILQMIALAYLVVCKLYYCHVRTTSLTCFAGMTSDVFFPLPESKRNYMTSSPEEGFFALGRDQLLIATITLHYKDSLVMGMSNVIQSNVIHGNFDESIR